MKQFKIVCAADIHGSSLVLARVSGVAREANADLIILAGDIVLHQIYNGFIDLLHAAAKHARCPIIGVAGNHDFWKIAKHFPDNAAYVAGTKKITKKSVIFLHEQEITYKGLKFWGSPYTSVYGNWNYQLPVDKLKFNPSIDTDVLITHSPPAFFNGSITSDNRDIGSEELTVVAESLPQLKLFIFGHNHQGAGYIGRLNNGATIINAACHTEDMRFNPQGIITVTVHNENS